MHFNRFPEKVLTFSSHDYCFRISVVYFITMLTFKTVLTILFILDFNKMTSIPEKIVIYYYNYFLYKCSYQVNIKNVSLLFLPD